METAIVTIKFSYSPIIKDRSEIFKILTPFFCFKPNDMVVRVESNDLTKELVLIIHYVPFKYDLTTQTKFFHSEFLIKYLYLIREIKEYDNQITLKIKRKDKEVRNPEYIMNKIEEYYELPKGTLSLKTKKREVVEKRQIAHYISRQAGFSFEKIGEVIGNVGHCTVLHSCKTVLNFIETNRKYKEAFLTLDRKI